jgi:hypothetical protein
MQGQKRTKIKDKMEMHAPADPGVKVLVHDVPHAQRAQVWAIRVVVPPGHEEARLVTGVKVTHGEVVVPASILLLAPEL